MPVEIGHVEAIFPLSREVHARRNGSSRPNLGWHGLEGDRRAGSPAH